MAISIYRDVFLAILRYLGPVWMGLILLQCGYLVLSDRLKTSTWANLETADGTVFPITHWECVIGRSRRCDITLPHTHVARNHAVLARCNDGIWELIAVRKRQCFAVNGQTETHCQISDGDQITIGDDTLTFSSDESRLLRYKKQRHSGTLSLILLTFLQMGILVANILQKEMTSAHGIIFTFAGMIGLEWTVFLLNRFVRKTGFAVETIAFLLCTLGMAVVCSVCPSEAPKQLAAVGMGIALYAAISWSIENLERIRILRYLAGAAGGILLIAVLLFGKVHYGAKNWLVIGSLSFQPSEIVKVCFVYVGASTLPRLMQKRNILLFLVYTVMLCGLLALMNDFGTALVFFFVFLLIAFLRSGSFGTIAFSCAALIFAAIIGLQIAPHALRRLLAWRHIWEDPLGIGYQQTRALMCIASGGLWGLGNGHGRMKSIFAADSDMVFATVCEEWGLIAALIPVFCIVVLALFALRNARVRYSSFYTIASCAAAGILLVQTAFNVLGTVDALPLTGITFPFLSNGGSSMIGAWGLLALLKGTDL